MKRTFPGNEERKFKCSKPDKQDLFVNRPHSSTSRSANPDPWLFITTSFNGYAAYWFVLSFILKE